MKAFAKRTTELWEPAVSEQENNDEHNDEMAKA